MQNVHVRFGTTLFITKLVYNKILNIEAYQVEVHHRKRSVWGTAPDSPSCLCCPPTYRANRRWGVADSCRFRLAVAPGVRIQALSPLVYLTPPPALCSFPALLCLINSPLSPSSCLGLGHFIPLSPSSSLPLIKNDEWGARKDSKCLRT